MSYCSFDYSRSAHTPHPSGYACHLRPPYGEGLVYSPTVFSLVCAQRLLREAILRIKKDPCMQVHRSVAFGERESTLR